METNDTPATLQIVKSRSYVASLREGLKFPLLHFGELCRFLWPAMLLLLILSLGTTLTELHLALGHKQLPALSTANGLAVAGLELIVLLSHALFMGHILYQQRTLTAQGTLPHAKSWKIWHEWLNLALRSLLCGAVVKLLFCLCVAALAISRLQSQWLWLLPSVFLLLLLLLLVPPFLEFLFSKVSLVVAFKTARWRHLGNTTAIVLLAGLISGLVAIAGSLPLFSLIGIDVQVFLATLQGDAVQLPAYIPCLRVVCILLSALAGAFATLLFLYPLLFHWGSTTALDQERKAQAAMPY